MKKKLITSLCCIVLLINYLLLGDYFGIYLFCPIRKFLGLYCPGCGVTRMLLSLLKGNFYQAFRYNPLVFVLLPFLITYYLDYLYSFFKNKKTKFHVLEPSAWYVLIGIFLIYGILRNFPFFEFLKPTVV